MAEIRTTDANPKQTFAEIKDMVTAYAKQETVDPIKALGGWILWGIVGAIFLTIGAFLVGLGALRYMQTEVSSFEGNWSFAPYLITFAMLVLFIGVAGFQMKRSIDLSESDHS